MTEARTNTKTVIPVRVFSDYTCPWCYIGTRRLERLRQQIEDDGTLSPGVELDVRWEPFEIHPEVPSEGMAVEDLGYPEERWKAMQEHLRVQAREEGIELGNRPKVSNTHEALAASAWVQDEEPDRFPCFHRALFRSYFTEGRDLGDRQVLLDVADECGVSASRLEEVLEEGRYDEVLEKTSREARGAGITGTPSYVFDDRYLAVGAQPVARLRSVLDRALERRAGS